MSGGGPPPPGTPPSPAAAAGLPGAPEVVAPAPVFVGVLDGGASVPVLAAGNRSAAPSSLSVDGPHPERIQPKPRVTARIARRMVVSRRDGMDFAREARTSILP